VRALSLYGSRFSFAGLSFYTLPNISVTNLRGTGGRHPRVTSPAPLFFDDGRVTFYADTRYGTLACGRSPLLDLTGRVFLGSAPGQRGHGLVDLYGRSFRLRVRSTRSGYSARLEIYSARIDHTYQGLHGTVAIRR